MNCQTVVTDSITIRMHEPHSPYGWEISFAKLCCVDHPNYWDILAQVSLFLLLPNSQELVLSTRLSNWFDPRKRV